MASSTGTGGGGLIGGITSAVGGVAGGVTGALTGDRNPLRTLSSVWGPVHSIAAGVITAGATLGMLNSKTSGFLNKGLSGADIVMAGLAGVIAGVAPLTALATVVKQGEQLVTPVTDPRDHEGNALTA